MRWGDRSENAIDALIDGTSNIRMALAASNAKARAKTHCKHGHEYTPENTRYDKKGHRMCRACGRVDSLRRYHAAKCKD